jgi:hypothetical protein
MKALIPQSPENLGGPFINAEDNRFEVLAIKEKIAIIEFHSRPEGIEWFEEFELLYCQIQHDAETIKVIRKATEEERRSYRIPLWIQGDHVPECCGRPMHFVGQIDDDTICTERPEDAKYWWHDAASFYVFTCSECMECKAVGQQF